MSDEERIPAEPAAKSSVEVRVVDDESENSQGEQGGQASWDQEEGEEVVRLEQAPEKAPEPASAPISELQVKRKVSQAEFVPSEEEEGKRARLNKLTLAMALGAAVLVVLGVVLVLDFHSAGGDAPTHSLGVVEEPDWLSDDPEEGEYSDAELEDLGKEAANMAVEYTKASRVDEALPFIRHGEDLREELEERWEPLPLKEGEKVNLSGRISELNDRLIIYVLGRDREDRDFMLVFCDETDGLKIDWEASMGIGEVAFDDLEKVPDGESARMRVFVEPTNFHPVQYPDDEYRCYRLLHLTGRSKVYGYAKHGSEAVAKLAAILNEGATLVAREKRVGAIVVLENAGWGASGQFVITEVIQGGWIEYE